MPLTQSFLNAILLEMANAAMGECPVHKPHTLQKESKKQEGCDRLRSAETFARKKRLHSANECFTMSAQRFVNL